MKSHAFPITTSDAMMTFCLVNRSSLFTWSHDILSCESRITIYIRSRVTNVTGCNIIPLTWLVYFYHVVWYEVPISQTWQEIEENFGYMRRLLTPYTSLNKAPKRPRQTLLLPSSCSDVDEPQQWTSGIRHRPASSASQRLTSPDNSSDGESSRD